jgi:hypothetical protein
MDRLWRRAERRKRMDDGRFADSRRAGDVNLPGQAHTVLQLDVGTDYTIRSDLDAVTDARTVGDARRRINRHLLLDQTGADPSRARRHTRKCRLPRNVVDRGGSVGR